MSKQFAFLNRRFLPIDRATVSVMDRGFHYGDGLFETILSRDGKPIDLPEHLVRMRDGAGVLRIPFPYSAPEVERFVITLLQKNGLRDALVKIMVTRGRATHIGLSPRLTGSRPTFCIFAWAINPSYRNKKSYSVVVASRPRDTTPISGLKTLNYLSHVVAKTEADRAGADEAIFVNSHGEVLEGTISNVFIVQKGKVITPPLSLGILDGITRRHVLRLTRRHKIPTMERSFHVNDLVNAEEAFLTMSSSGVMPIAKANRRKIGPVCPGPVAQDLQSRLGEWYSAHSS